MKNQFNFLSEQPERDNLRFGHQKILESLVDIIGKCPKPFTIGLFGRWGSGKSSIAESLPKALAPKDIPVVLFDVWKHEGDALRRTFLKEIYQQLRQKYGSNFFDMNFVLNARVEGNVQKALAEDFKWKKLLMIFLKYCVLPLLVLILCYLILDRIWPVAARTINNWRSEAITLTFLMAVLQFVYTYFKDLSVASDVLITQNRLTDPHDFQEEFNRILNATKCKKIVIIFDNLDRVSGENALTIISTIKTFLDPVDRDNKKKEVVFLLPCDVNAIKNHISVVMRTQSGLGSALPYTPSDVHDYADEYLRKFFNTIIWIPEFYEVELETYAREKLKETTIKEFDNPELAWLIIQVFSQNPRQIVQFINVLISNYVVMKEVSESNGFGNKDFHKQNVPQLAKFILLVQRFPMIMDAYRISKSYDLMSPFPVDAKNLPSVTEFIRFRDNTAGITIASLEPFFTFKISDYERDLPGVSRLFELMDNHDVEEASKEATNLEIAKKQEQFGGAVRNYLKNKTNNILVTNFLDVLFALTAAHKITFTTNTYLALQKSLQDNGLTHVERITPHLLADEFINKETGIIITENVKVKTVSRWVDVLRNQSGETKQVMLSDETEMDMLRQLQKMHVLIKPELQTLLKGVSAAKADKPAVAEVLVDCDVQEKFLSKEFVEKCVQRMMNLIHEPEQVKQYQSIIGRIEVSLVDQVSIEFLLENMKDFMDYANQLPDMDDKINVINSCTMLMSRFTHQFQQDRESSAASAFVNAIQATHSNLGNPARPAFMLLAERLAGAANQLYPAVVKRIRSDFVSSIHHFTPEVIEQSLSNLKDPEIYIKEYKEQIRQNLRSYPDKLIAVYKFASADIKLDFLTNWINETRFEWITTLAQTIISAGIPDRASVFDAVVNRLKAHNNPADWEFALTFVNQLQKIGGGEGEDIFQPTPSSVENLLQMLLAKFQHDDSNVQNMALNWVNGLVYLSDDDKATIGSKLIGWLRTIGYAFKPTIYDAINAGLLRLNIAEKIDYVNYLIDYVVLQSGSSPEITKAIACIVQTGIDAQDFLPQLEKIKAKALAQQVANPLLTKMLMEGLYLLTEKNMDAAVKKLHEESLKVLTELSSQ